MTDFDNRNLILDDHKLAWHLERLTAWEAGERIAPVTIDIALTRQCNYSCQYCFAMFQENTGHRITIQHMDDFIDDCAAVGVRAISYAGDGENTIHPAFSRSIIRAGERGIDMAVNSNGLTMTPKMMDSIMDHLTYIRINITAAEPARYAQIMGAKPDWLERVVHNIEAMVALKRTRKLSTTIGLQMVLVPEYQDQILPLAELARRLEVDYLVIKHCSDDEGGAFNLNYKDYEPLYEKIRQAEALSSAQTLIAAKWTKIQEGNDKRNYQRCYGPPFMLQISGTGTVAPCGQLFNDKFKRYHMGNICETRFKDILESDSYWEVVNHLASARFNAQRMCGSLCRPHYVNDTLDRYRKGYLPIAQPTGELPAHVNFL